MLWSFLVLRRSVSCLGTPRVLRGAFAVWLILAGCARPTCVSATRSGSDAPPGVTRPALRTVGPAPLAPRRAASSLREAVAPTGRRIGVALATWFFEEPEYSALAAQHFDSVTAENEMKWYATEPEPGRFTFEAADRLVSFAEQHHMRVRGHTLVWHKQLAPWVKTLQGEELRPAMLRHVRSMVEHWKGRVAQWDVVNEAIDDAGRLRNESPFTTLGPSYVAEAFQAAHAADPRALLFYNEYDIESDSWPKTEGAYQLVKSLKDSGVPIHGIGLQMHLEPRNWPDADEMRRNIARFAELGLLVELTEIDIPVGELPGTRAQKLEAQRGLTRGVVSACLRVPACTGLTFWGLTDKHSWLASPEWEARRGRGPHLALPFDANYRPKPMYQGVVDALAGR
jgi:endo-1,4-beta-xylanase